MKKIKRSRSITKKANQTFAKSVERYAAKRAASLTNTIDRSTRYFAIEGIHDLRVEIKRIRALLELMKAILPSFKIEHELKAIRPLFKKQGNCVI